MAVLVVDLVVLVPFLHPVRSTVVAPVLLLLPGWLSLGLIRGQRPTGWADDHRAGWEDVAWSLGLSVLWLMVGGVVLSAVPAPVGGLTSGRCLVGFDLLVACLVLSRRLGLRTRGTVPGAGPSLEESRERLVMAVRHSLTDLRLLGPALGAVAVVLAAVGAARLNGGGSPTIAVAALVAAVLAVLARTRSAVDRPGSDAVTLWLVGLAVLLGTSLRGASISGHDIASEYRLFLATARSGTWSPGGPLRGYQSCLSITVLPTVLLRLTAVAPADVFRVLFQLVFATAPALVYGIARRLLGPRPAVLAGALFVAFPTFVNDMAWITRQEIAFVFFFLAVLAAVGSADAADLADPAGADPPGGERATRAVGFLLAGLGMVLAHYSTTYVALFIFAFAAATMAARRRRRGERPASTVLTLPLVGILVVAAVAWGAFNGTTGGFTTTVRTSASALAGGGGVREGATSYSFIDAPRHLSGRQALTAFADYESAAYHGAIGRPAPQASCPVAVLAGSDTPVSLDGQALGLTGVDPSTLVGWLRAGSVILFELGAVAGLAVLWRRPGRRGRVRTEFLLMGGATVIALGAVVVLPQLSVSYGLLRVYQQALVLLAPMVVLGCTAVAVRRRDDVVAAVVAGVFLVTSGVVPQALGGYAAQLNLNNSGQYASAYYVAGPDLRAAAWLQAHRPGARTWILTDLDGATVLQSQTNVAFVDALYPGLVPASAVVVARTEAGNGAAIAATAVYNDQIVSYTFPVSCLGARPVLFREGRRVVLGPAPTRSGETAG